MDERLMANVWLRLGNILGKGFYAQFGEEANDEWRAVIARLSPESLERVFKRLLLEKPKFFDLPAFVDLARPRKAKNPSHVLFLPNPSISPEVFENGANRLAQLRKNL